MKFLTEMDIRAMQLCDGGALPLPAGTALTPGAREYCNAHRIVAQPAKPEHMTHLNGNTLVPKTHPRIRLRGKLDSLEALMLQTIQQARNANRPEIAEALEELYRFTQQILACEVKEVPLPPITLLGLDSAGLRRASHVGLHAPGSGMSALALALNFLRTQARETELYACDAFVKNQECQRSDIIEALNRLNSAVYILYMREIQ